MPKKKKEHALSRQTAFGLIQYDENVYRTILQTSLDGFLINDSTGRILDVNDAGCRMLGYSRDEMLLMNISDLECSESPEARAARIQRIVALGRDRFHGRLRHKDGITIEVEVSIQHAAALDDQFFVFFRDISERKLAEEDIRRMNTLLTSIIENLPNTIFLKDAKELRFLLFNRAGEELVGYSRHEVHGKNDYDFTPKEQADFFVQKDQEVLRGKTVIDIPEERLQTRTNGVRILHTKKVPLLDANGEPEFLLGISEDITEHRHADAERESAVEALRKSEQQYRLLADNSVDVISRHSADGTVLYVTPSCEILTGYTAAELVGKPASFIVLPEDFGRIWDAIHNVTSGQDTYRVEYRILRKDGTIIWSEMTGRLIRDESGTISEIQCNIRDITARMQAETDRQQALALLETAINQSPYGILVADAPSVTIRIANPAALGIRGGTDLPLSGISVDQHSINWHIFRPDGTPYPPEELPLSRAVLKGETIWGDEAIIRSENGEDHWVSSNSAPVRNRDGKITAGIVIFHDISERKHAEQALRNSQKLESIGTLAGGIAHDFNNLLNAVLGQTSLALGKLPPENEAVSHLTKAISAAEHAADLTRQLLAYSGKGRFVTEEIDLNRLVKDNVQILELAVPKTCRLRFDYSSPSPRIRADAGQIQQVIMNLIINAGEALGTDSGDITLQTSRIDVTEQNFDFSKYSSVPLPPGAYALLEVNDTGCGITPDHLERIFDPFFTTKFTGRGLGLAAVLGIVRGHNGGIRIQSEPGVGTRFTVVLPLIESHEMAKTQDALPGAKVNGDGVTVLVIDDEPAVLELLKDVFTDAKFSVLSALNPVDGIELYRQHQKHISAVVLDYSMPGMDGATTFLELTKINSNVNVLLCSGYTEEEAIKGFGQRRPYGFIQKPYKPAQILDWVMRMISV